MKEMTMIFLSAGYSVLLLFFLNYVKRPDYREKYILRKTIQSAAFLAVFFVAEMLTEFGAFFWQVFPAFLCCFAGDVLLAAYNKIRKKRIFAAGLFAFLAGHLFFIHWMSGLQPVTAADFLFPVFGVLLVWILTGSSNIHTGRLRPCILIYSFFVSFLCAKGIHLFLAQKTLSAFLLAIGSFLFLASDFSIIFLYFYKNKDKRIHLFNLATYYYAMLFLACSLAFM